MTVILPFGRILIRQPLSRSNYLFTRLASSNPLVRASCCESNDPGDPRLGRKLQHNKHVNPSRGYATDAAAKPASRPKAHTGRAAAKKSPAKTKSTATAKKAATKATSKRKTKAKAKPKPKPKPKAKKVVTKKKSPPSATALLRARAAKTKELKTKALLNEPKHLPSSAYQLYFTEQAKGVSLSGTLSENTKEIARKYKTLTSEELERLNHTSNQNKAKNESAYKSWVSQHTPVEIREANNARKALNIQAKAGKGRKKPIKLIKDDRLVKQSISPYIYFNKDRYASGDFKHMAIAEASRLVSKEWKALDPSEKKSYQDKAEADLARYKEEYQTVYGKKIPSSPRRKTT